MFGPKWQEGRIVAAENRLAELEKQMEKTARIAEQTALRVRELKRERRELLTEWETTFEKFNALWARLSKRLPRKDNGRSQQAPADASPDSEPDALNPLALNLIGGSGGLLHG